MRALALVSLAIVMLTPFLWMVSTSLMDELEAFLYPPRLLPARPLWSNYPGALSAQPFGRFFANSLVFALLLVAGQLVTSATAGYAFARLAFRGRDRLSCSCSRR